MLGRSPDDAVLVRSCPHCGTDFHRALDPAIHEYASDNITSEVHHAVQEGYLGNTGDDVTWLFAYICTKHGGRTRDHHVALFQHDEVVACIQLRPL